MKSLTCTYELIVYDIAEDETLTVRATRPISTIINYSCLWSWKGSNPSYRFRSSQVYTAGLNNCRNSETLKIWPKRIHGYGAHRKY